MRRTIRPVLFLLAALPGVLFAQTIACDAMYAVQRGDSLSSIAARAYGRATAYQIVFDYNPGILKAPDDLPVGVQLYIPCMERGTAPASLPALAKATGGMKLLTGSKYPPYVDRGLPEGGFSVEVVRRALAADDDRSDYRIDVIDDWEAQLQPLLADGCYALGFPWYKPNCEQKERLGEASIWRCDNLVFSRPLHEVVISFYARADAEPTMRTIEDLKGTRICRPRGYFTHDLEAKGLTPPAIVRVAPDNPKDCFERLLNREVDLVSVNAETADRVIAELDIRDRVADLIRFATVESLHVVGMKGDPLIKPRMLRVDQGILRLHDTGEFRVIAERHLTR